MSENELSERCRQKDNSARKELYELYAGQMLAICCRYAGDRDTAKDLMHDGFIKAYNSFDKFTYRGEGSLKAWLARIMVNTSLEYLRKNDILNQTLTLESVPEAPEEPDDGDIEQVPKQMLMRFIEELPPGYRTVFNLFVFEEKPHKEIARLLGINEKSSSSQFFRAKSLLAKRIKEYMNRRL
ncbi:RNA polymerase sigma factor [Phocaeicola sp.]